MNKIKVLFMGRKPVATKCLSWLLSQKNISVVAVLTDNQNENSCTATLANNESVPLLNFDECLTMLKSGSLKFDLGISMLFWRKLKGEFISMPKLGTINFHPAPLPDYKGTAGYNLAILDGLNEWAMTAHYVDEEIDTGEIIKVLPFPICEKSETVISLESRSQIILFDLFKDILKQTLSLNKKLDTTPNVGGRYISRNEMEEMKIIQEGDDIPRKIRAFWFPPYDGAYVEIEGKKYSLVDEGILKSLANSNFSKVF